MLPSEVAFGVQLQNTLKEIFLSKKSQKEQKGSKDKADTHRTAQPKDYGIMAGQIRWLRRVVVLPCHPSGFIPFPFGFSACPPC